MRQLQIGGTAKGGLKGTGVVAEAAHALRPCCACCNCQRMIGRCKARVVQRRVACGASAAVSYARRRVTMRTAFTHICRHLRAPARCHCYDTF